MVIMVKIGSSMIGERLVIMGWMAMMQSLVLDVAVEVERLRTNLNSTQYFWKWIRNNQRINVFVYLTSFQEIICGQRK